MATKLTARQREILMFVQRYADTRGYPPSVREIGQAMGLTSSSTVHSHLAALARKGYLRRDPSKPRALEVLSNGKSHARSVSWPIVGQVAAGLPITAEQNVEAYLALPADLARDDGFVLRVKGDSMIEDGIYDGDLLIVRHQKTANDGDIVVARVEDEATVKRFYREGDKIRLQPANQTMSPIYARDVEIEGKAIGVFRRLV